MSSTLVRVKELDMPRIAWFAFASVLLCSGLPSLPLLAQQQQPQMSSAQQMALEDQNEQMFTDMRRVAQWLDQYCLWNKRFPEFGDEMIQAQQQLNQLTPNNPYKDDQLTLGRGLDAQPGFGNFDYQTNSYNNADVYQMQYPVPDDQNANLNRIQLSINNSLSEEQAQEWLRQPPEEWQAPPGTISAIGNQQNMYVLWGAGRDGRPLRDALSHRTQLIIGRFAMLNNQE
jgi:hypothetical protein